MTDLAAPGSTIGGYRVIGAGSSKKLSNYVPVGVQQPKAPGRSLLGQLADIGRGLPGGILDFVGKGLQTVAMPAHLIYDAVVNPEDIAGMHSIGDFTNQYLPLPDMIARSMGHTAARLIHPSRYLKAIDDSQILGVLLEDLGNAAIVAGGIGGAAGAAGDAAAAAGIRAGATAVAEEAAAKGLTVGSEALQKAFTRAAKTERGTGVAGMLDRAGYTDAAQSVTRAGTTLKYGAHKLENVAFQPFPALRWASGKLGDALVPGIEQMVSERIGRPYEVRPRGGIDAPVRLSEAASNALVGTRLGRTAAFSRLTPEGRAFQAEISVPTNDAQLRAQMEHAKVGEVVEKVSKETGVKFSREGDPNYDRLSRAATAKAVGDYKQLIDRWAEDYRKVANTLEEGKWVAELGRQLNVLMEGASDSAQILTPEAALTLVQDKLGMLSKSDQAFLDQVTPALQEMYGVNARMGEHNPEQMGTSPLTVEQERQRQRLQRERSIVQRRQERAYRNMNREQIRASVLDALGMELPAPPRLTDVMRRGEDVGKVMEQQRRLAVELRSARKALEAEYRAYEAAANVSAADLADRIESLDKAKKRFDELVAKEGELRASAPERKAKASSTLPKKQPPPEPPPAPPSPPEPPAPPTPPSPGPADTPPSAPSSPPSDAGPATAAPPAREVPAAKRTPSENPGKHTTKLSRLREESRPQQSATPPDVRTEQAKVSLEQATQRRQQLLNERDQLQAKAPDQPSSAVSERQPDGTRQYSQPEKAAIGFVERWREVLKARRDLKSINDTIDSFWHPKKSKAKSDGEIQTEALEELVNLGNPKKGRVRRLDAVDALIEREARLLATSSSRSDFLVQRLRSLRDVLTDPKFPTMADELLSGGGVAGMSEASQALFAKFREATQGLNLQSSYGLSKIKESELKVVEDVVNNDYASTVGEQAKKNAKAYAKSVVGTDTPIVIGRLNNNELWWSNTYALAPFEAVADTIAKDFSIGTHRYDKTTGWSSSPEVPRFDPLIDRSLKGYTREINNVKVPVPPADTPLTPVGLMPWNGLDKVLVVMQGPDGTRVAFQRDYVAMLGADEIRAPLGFSDVPAAAYRNGKLVGIVMPVKIENAELLGVDSLTRQLGDLSLSSAGLDGRFHMEEQALGTPLGTFDDQFNYSPGSSPNERLSSIERELKQLDSAIAFHQSDVTRSQATAASSPTTPRVRLSPSEARRAPTEQTFSRRPSPEPTPAPKLAETTKPVTEVRHPLVEQMIAEGPKPPANRFAGVAFQPEFKDSKAFAALRKWFDDTLANRLDRPEQVTAADLRLGDMVDVNGTPMLVITATLREGYVDPTMGNSWRERFGEPSAKSVPGRAVWLIPTKLKAEGRLNSVMYGLELDRTVDRIARTRLSETAAPAFDASVFERAETPAPAPKLAETAKPTEPAATSTNRKFRTPELSPAAKQSEVLSQLGIEQPNAWRSKKEVDPGGPMWQGDVTSINDAFHDGLKRNRRNDVVWTEPLRTVDEVKAAAGNDNFIVCIACGAEKLDRPAPAAEMYTSDVFKKNLAAARALVGGDDSRIRIVSAKHGYLPLDEVIDPYDVSFNMSFDQTIKSKDSVILPRQMRMQGLNLPEAPVVVIGGKQYVGAVMATAGERKIIPTFAGSEGIGAQKQIATEIANSAKTPEPAPAPAPKLAAGGGASGGRGNPPAPPTGGTGATPDPMRAGMEAARLPEARGRRLEAARGLKLAEQAVDRAVTRATRTERFVRTKENQTLYVYDMPGSKRKVWTEPPPEGVTLKRTISKARSNISKLRANVSTALDNVERGARVAEAVKTFGELTPEEKQAGRYWNRARDKNGNVVKRRAYVENLNRTIGVAQERARVATKLNEQLVDRLEQIDREIADIPVVLARPAQAQIRDLLHGKSERLPVPEQKPTGDKINEGDWIEMEDGKWGRVVRPSFKDKLDARGQVVMGPGGIPEKEFTHWVVDMGDGTTRNAVAGPEALWRWSKQGRGSVGRMERQLRSLRDPVGEVGIKEVVVQRDPVVKQEVAVGHGVMWDVLSRAAGRKFGNAANDVLLNIIDTLNTQADDRARVEAIGMMQKMLDITDAEMKGLNESLIVDEHVARMSQVVNDAQSDGSWLDLPYKMGRMTEGLDFAPQEWQNRRNQEVFQFHENRVRTLSDDALNVQAMPARFRAPAQLARRQVKDFINEARRLSDSGDELAAREQLTIASEIATNIGDLLQAGVDPIHAVGGRPDANLGNVGPIRRRPTGEEMQRRTPFRPLTIESAQRTQLGRVIKKIRNEAYDRVESTFGKTPSQIDTLSGWLTEFVDANRRFPTADEYINAARDVGWVPLNRSEGLGPTKTLDFSARKLQEFRQAEADYETAVQSGNDAQIQRARFLLDETDRAYQRSLKVTPAVVRKAWNEYQQALDEVNRLNAALDGGSINATFDGAGQPRARSGSALPGDRLALAEQRLEDARAVLAEAEEASMPKLVPEDIAREMRRDASLWDRGMLPGFKFLARTNRAFKTQVLPLSARWYVNNTIGNMVMAAAFGGVSPIELVRNVRALQREIGFKGVGRASQAAFEESILSGKFDVGNVRASRLANSSLFDTQRRGLGLTDFEGTPARTRAGARLQRVTDVGYGVNEFFDNVARSAVYLAKIDKYLTKAVRTGIDVSTTEGFTNVANAALRDTLKAMGDFTNMAPWQRKYLRQVFPFWSWIRHSTVAAMRLPIESPLRAAMLAQLSVLANDKNLTGEELSFFSGKWNLGNGSVLSLGSVSPIDSPLTNPLFDPPSLLRSLAPALKVATAATTGIDMGRLSQVTKPPNDRRRGAFGQQVADPLLYHPSELLGYAVGQFPLLRNLRNFVDGPSIRYGTGEPIKDKRGNPISSGQSRAGSLAAILGVPLPEQTTQNQLKKLSKTRIKLGQ